MKIEKLPSGSYRIRKMHEGKRITLIFDHKPNDIEIAEKMIDKFGSSGNDTTKAFRVCAKEYISVKSSVISPSTIRSYESMVRNMSKEFLKLDVFSVNSVSVQKEINDYAKTHSPKSTRNLSGFISAVIHLYRPDANFNCTLPQKKPYEGYCPTENDIKRILKEAYKTELYVPYQLGILGLRRSEICAISGSDIKGNKLTISKGKVQNGSNKWVIKPYAKTETSNRTIYIPEELAKEIKEKGYAYDNNPEMLNRHLHEIQNKLDIPQFRFHDLRHYFASYSHQNGLLTEAEILEMGGWNSSYTMKRVYREAMKEKKEENQTKLGKSILPVIEPTDFLG